MMIIIITIISTEQTTKTLVPTNYRIRESSPRSRHNKYLKSSKLNPYSQIVNKTHFNIITFSISKVSEACTHFWDSDSNYACISQVSHACFQFRLPQTCDAFTPVTSGAHYGLRNYSLRGLCQFCGYVLNILNTVLVSQNRSGFPQSCVLWLQTSEIRNVWHSM